ncbi:MAG: hypothetical protein OXG06_01290 [Gammaproteobacteria bacterium]|nr:hypothetical protein [Gammaproteobacteria bacterium]
MTDSPRRCREPVADVRALAGCQASGPRVFQPRTSRFKGLFRNVPPPLTLALAMTEGHEKAKRAAIMREHGCSELEAVYIIAEQIPMAR